MSSTSIRRATTLQPPPKPGKCNRRRRWTSSSGSRTSCRVPTYWPKKSSRTSSSGWGCRALCYCFWVECGSLRELRRNSSISPIWSIRWPPSWEPSSWPRLPRLFNIGTYMYMYEVCRYIRKGNFKLSFWHTYSLYNKPTTWSSRKWLF